MKAKIFTLAAITGALILGGCASNSYVVDDVYYSPDLATPPSSTVVVSGERSTQPAEASGDEIFSSIDDYYKSNTYNEDTLKASGADLVEEGNGNVVINNYNDPTLSYAARINHFYNPSVGFGYYDPFYDPWYYGSGLSFSIGVGFGFGYPYYPGYMPPYYPYTPYMPYYPYYPPYAPGYGGCCCCAGVPYYPYYGDDYYQKGTTYGPRRSTASNRIVAPDGVQTPMKNSLIPSSTTSSKIATGVTPARGNSGLPATSRRVSSGSTRATGSGTTGTSVRSQRSNTAATASTRNRDVVSPESRNTTATTRVYQPRRSTAGSASMRTTRLSTTTSSATRSSAVRSNGVAATKRVRTTTGTRSYVPRYTNTRSTKASVRPTYNTSRSATTTRSRSVTSSPVMKKSYSYPSRRSGGTTYSTPRRSSSSYSTPSRSYSPSSSSSYSPSRSSVSTSSSSRSSGGRRR